MLSTFRFRLYPAREQEVRMLRALEACRRLWNGALAHRRERWEKEHESTSYFLQQSILTAERHADSDLGKLHAQVAQDVLHRLDRAFRAFFEHRYGYPRFKKFAQSGSFTYPQAYNGSVKPDTKRRRLFLSKIGNVPIVFHRPLPNSSRLKICTIVREPDGNWFACLVFETTVPKQEINHALLVRPVGIDLGLHSLITTSEGEKVPHPRFLRKTERRLKRAQRTFSRKKKGSNNQSKVRQRVASLHARVRRQRSDFNHKLSAQLLREHSFIAFEDIRIGNLVGNHRLAKSIMDAGWGQLIRFTEYKGARITERLVVRVPSAYSTKECCFCGTLNHVTLSVREYYCAGCQRWLDRDINAAQIVVKRAFIAQVGQHLPELKPVEIWPLLPRNTEGASRVEEAGTTFGEKSARELAVGSPQLQSWEEVTKFRREETRTTLLRYRSGPHAASLGVVARPTG